MKCYKVVVCVPMLIVFSSIFFSCEKTPVEPSGLNKELIGKWVIKEFNVKGSMSSGGITIPMDTTFKMTNDNNFLKFYLTNTYRFELDEKLLSKTKSLKKVALLTDVFKASSDTGSWVLAGNNLTLTSAISNAQESLKISIVDTMMETSSTFKYSESGQAMDLEMVYGMVKR